MTELQCWIFQSDSLVAFENSKPKYTPSIAKIVAKIHTLRAPIRKDGANWLFDTMSNWYESVSEAKSTILPTSKDPLVAKVLSHDYLEEMNWLRNVLPMINSPVVFCHNDLQGGNLLLKRGPGSMDERIVAIDYEFCGYNYRAFDIANVWAEFSYDYTSNSNYPYYFVDESKYPSRDQQVRSVKDIEFLSFRLPFQILFLKAYLEQIRNEQADSKHWIPEGDDEAVEQLLTEIDLFAAVPYLFWTLWCIHNAVTSDIQFGYWVSIRDEAMAIDLFSCLVTALCNREIHKILEKERMDEA